jgi:hypothetical protein
MIPALLIRMSITGSEYEGTSAAAALMDSNEEISKIRLRVLTAGKSVASS